MESFFLPALVIGAMCRSCLPDLHSGTQISSSHLPPDKH